MTQLKTKDANDNQEIMTAAEEAIAEEEAPKPVVKETKAPAPKPAAVKPAAKPEPKPEPKKKANKKPIDPLDVVEADPVFKTQ